MQQMSASAKECEPKADCADTKLSWDGNAHTEGAMAELQKY